MVPLEVASSRMTMNSTNFQCGKRSDDLFHSPIVLEAAAYVRVCCSLSSSETLSLSTSRVLKYIDLLLMLLRVIKPF